MRTSDYCTYTSLWRIGYALLIEVFFVFLFTSFTTKDTDSEPVNSDNVVGVLARLGASSAQVGWVFGV